MCAHSFRRVRLLEVQQRNLAKYRPIVPKGRLRFRRGIGPIPHTTKGRAGIRTVTFNQYFF